MSLAATAFLSPLPLTRPHRPRRAAVARCAAGPPPGRPRDLPPGGPSSRDLSATDREYLSKVRARLFNARRRADAARDLPSPSGAKVAAHEQLDAADLPDDLDAMEDILFDRTPSNAAQVRMFGGWLDEAVAGRKADDPDVKPPASGAKPVEEQVLAVTSELDEEAALLRKSRQADQVFQTAMNLFNKGRYHSATESFAAAAALVGANSRLGGQYNLWYAQACDAAGEKGLAEKMLTALSTHMDGDVRKVAAELHFIITAPKLQLDPGSFLEIPCLDESVSPNMQGVLMSNFGPLPTAFVDKPPEPYSLQWYMEKKRAPKTEDHSMSQAALLLIAIIGTLGYMFSSPHA